MRNKPSSMHLRHSLWPTILNTNLYVASCSQYRTMQSKCFLECSLFGFGTLDLEARFPIYVAYVCAHNFENIHVSAHQRPHSPTRTSPPHAASPRSVSQLPKQPMPHCQSQFWQLPDPSLVPAVNPQRGGCWATKPESGSCET